MRFSAPFKYEKDLGTDEEKLLARKLTFAELTQVCLWGNSTDLSLLIDMVSPSQIGEGGCELS